ncbi:hypothetical protein HELRODRAFT_184849 [Helobdella robusta]|uniref:Uncharacterized protein n=1 Tax=Helobdella robusta TaxID=6412 RepID=T1FM29_HELRO|nr:hypothetical protein HELRODRAFT_184849 [Helobdella robusta]ESO12847.1 hypothetical protein HELRODRAFT_184849 [Helobdella robusta]
MGEWKNGIFGCFNDCTVCIITYFLPCYTAGKNAEAVGKSCFLYGCLTCIEPIGCILRSTIRQQIREQYSIDGSFGGDLLCHMCCPCCALVQEAQELSAGGQSMNR